MQIRSALSVQREPSAARSEPTRKQLALFVLPAHTAIFLGPRHLQIARAVRLHHIHLLALRCAPPALMARTAKRWGRHQVRLVWHVPQERLFRHFPGNACRAPQVLGTINAVKRPAHYVQQALSASILLPLQSRLVCSAHWGHFRQQQAHPCAFHALLALLLHLLV